MSLVSKISVFNREGWVSLRRKRKDWSKVLVVQCVSGMEPGSAGSPRFNIQQRS